MATPLQKANCALWFYKTKCLKRVERLCMTEFGTVAPFKPSIYAFFIEFRETVCLCKGEVLFATRCMDGPGVPAGVYVYNCQ
jgi:hypothetical protein